MNSSTSAINIGLVLLALSLSSIGALVLFSFLAGIYQRKHGDGTVFDPPTRREMQRYMLCGIYCNPDDPRAVVHRPRGRGYTLNLRRDAFATLFIMLLGLAFLATVIYALSGSPMPPAH